MKGKRKKKDKEGKCEGKWKERTKGKRREVWKVWRETNGRKGQSEKRRVRWK